MAELNEFLRNCVLIIPESFRAVRKLHLRLHAKFILSSYGSYCHISALCCKKTL